MMPSHVASQFSGGAVRKALALDSTSGIAIAQLSVIAAFDEGRWADAERAYRQVPAGEPLNADLHVRYATYLRVLGRFGDAAHKFHVAHELEPLTVELPKNRLDEKSHRMPTQVR